MIGAEWVLLLVRGMSGYGMEDRPLQFHEPHARRGCPLSAEQRKTPARNEFFAF
jgi:hypothetical protein